MQRYICICIYIYIFNIASQKPHLHTSQKGFLDYLVPLGFRWFKVDIKESVVKLDESLKAFDTFNEWWQVPSNHTKNSITSRDHHWMPCQHMSFIFQVYKWMHNEDYDGKYFSISRSTGSHALLSLQIIPCPQDISLDHKWTKSQSSPLMQTVPQHFLLSSQWNFCFSFQNIPSFAVFFLPAKSLANSQILSKNRFLSANPEAFVETKKQLVFPRIQTVRKKPRNENLFIYLGEGCCLILGASWHLGVTNEKIWGEKTKMDERETFILGSFKTKHAHEKRWLSTSYSCAPQIRVLHHLFGSSNLCTEVIITDRCSKPSRSEIIELGETSPVRRHQNWWHLEYIQTINRIGKNIPAVLRNNNIASINFKPKHNHRKFGWETSELRTFKNAKNSVK